MFAIQEVDGAKRQWELPEGRSLTIGRAPDNDIRIDDLRVSRHHAIIRSTSRLRADLSNISNGNVVILNGTQVNAETGDRALRVGDQIRIVATIFNVAWTDEPPLSYTDEPLSMTTSMVPAERGVSALLMTTSSQRTKDEELKELRRKAEMLAQLCEMSAALASDFDAGSILDYATGVVMRTIPADCCAALLIEQGEDPRPVSLRFRQPNSASSQPLISRTAVRTAIEKRVMLSSHDVLKDINLNVSQSAVMQGIRSLACAPLVGSEGVYGALYIDRRDLLETFTEVDTQLLAAVAAQAAIAVEAARARERAQREALARAAFARFMPEHIIRELVENPQKFQLGGTNKRISALFCDVRGFAKLSHRARPETIVDLLNILFTEMAAEIFEHHGTLNKYLGDGLMALFGAPVEGVTDAADAVNAAIGMQRRIKGVNAQLAAKNLPRVTLGIGINTGEATVGVIGAEQRSEYTAIGDTINIASRIEGQAKPGQVLVTAATAQELGGQFPLSEPWSVEVKNIDEPVQIHSVIYEDAETDTPQTTDIPQT